jgi:hypothetical protein
MTGPVIEVADPETGEIVTLPGLPALPGATPLGLDLPPSLSWEQWSAYGATLQVAHRSIMWLLGDWLVYGERRWPDRYTQAVEATGRAVQTLRNAAWVAGAIPPAGRHPGVSWSHHAEVASLEPAERNDLLGWAASMVVDRGELRAEIGRRGLRQPRKPAESDPMADANAELQLSLDLSRWLAEGRRIAAQVRRGVAFAVVSVEQDSLDELVELIQVLDRAACDDARRAA